MEETPGRASLEKLGCRTPPQLYAGGVGRQQQQHVPHDVPQDVPRDVPQDVPHLFNCTAHPTALTPENVCDRQVWQDNTRTEISRSGEPGLTAWMVKRAYNNKISDNIEGLSAAKAFIHQRCAKGIGVITCIYKKHTEPQSAMPILTARLQNKYRSAILIKNDLNILIAVVCLE